MTSECWKSAESSSKQRDISLNQWTGIWNGMMEWRMERNSEHTQLQLTHVTSTAQSRLNYLVYL